MWVKSAREKGQHSWTLNGGEVGPEGRRVALAYTECIGPFQLNALYNPSRVQRLLE